MVRKPIREHSSFTASNTRENNCPGKEGLNQKLNKSVDTEEIRPKGTKLYLHVANMSGTVLETYSVPSVKAKQGDNIMSAIITSSTLTEIEGTERQQSEEKWACPDAV